MEQVIVIFSVAWNYGTLLKDTDKDTRLDADRVVCELMSTT